MLKNPTARKIFKYGLMLIYAAVFVVFYFLDDYFRYTSKLSDSHINEAWEEGRSHVVWNTATYIYTALLSTYVLVWLRIKHIAYKIFVTILILANLAVILYLGFTYQYGFDYIYILLGLFFHGDFLRRIWRKTPISKNK